MPKANLINNTYRSSSNNPFLFSALNIFHLFLRSGANNFSTSYMTRAPPHYCPFKAQVIFH